MVSLISNEQILRVKPAVDGYSSNLSIISMMINKDFTKASEVIECHRKQLTVQEYKFLRGVWCD